MLGVRSLPKRQELHPHHLHTSLHRGDCAMGTQQLHSSSRGQTQAQQSTPLSSTQEHAGLARRRSVTRAVTAMQQQRALITKIELQAGLRCTDGGLQ